jgi:hypothetical protein
VKDEEQLREEGELQNMERSLGETRLDVKERQAVVLLAHEILLADETASWSNPGTVEEDLRLVEAVQYDAVQQVRTENEPGAPPAFIQVSSHQAD